MQITKAELEGERLTPDDLAKRTGLSKGTLANWRYLGCGPKFRKCQSRPGAKRCRVYYLLSDVIAWERMSPTMKSTVEAA